MPPFLSSGPCELFSIKFRVIFLFKGFRNEKSFLNCLLGEFSNVLSTYSDISAKLRIFKILNSPLLSLYFFYLILQAKLLPLITL